MGWLLDTNLLLRFADTAAPEHLTARTAIEALVGRGEEVYLTTQNFIEFWAVATRPPEANGLGWSVSDAEARVRSLKLRFLFLADTEAIFDEWLRLVSSLQIKGKRAHDARLRAVMSVHGISNLLTFNTEDFSSFPNITIAHPNDILGGQTSSAVQ